MQAWDETGFYLDYALKQPQNLTDTGLLTRAILKTLDMRLRVCGSLINKLRGTFARARVSNL